MENTERKSYFIPTVIQRIGWVIGGIILAVFLAFIFGYFVMLLWNWIMPALFGLPVITYWMGFGIIILARLIFGGFGHGSPHDKWGHHDRFHNSKFRNKCRPPFDRHNKWRHYEDFWKDEGEMAFDKYVTRKLAESEIPTEKNPAE
jgi:hypothetical protein